MLQKVCQMAVFDTAIDVYILSPWNNCSNKGIKLINFNLTFQTVKAKLKIINF